MGTILIVTPRISANDFIWLKVNPTVSSFFGKDTETINGQVTTADIFDLRTIDTQVLIPNAHTLVMGGLVQDNPNAPIHQGTRSSATSPFWVSPSAVKTNRMDKDNLLIFITPTIVRRIRISSHRPTISSTPNRDT